MHLKLLLLLVAFADIILSQSAQKEEEEEECMEWYPEPVSFKEEHRNERLQRVFRSLHDLLEGREGQLIQRAEQFVLNAFDSKSTGLGDVISIVFNFLPSIRQLIVVFLCLITSEILFVIFWTITLIDMLDELVCHLHNYRTALTILPMFCVLFLFSIYSYIDPNVKAASEGIATFETRNDQNFIPIRTRFQKRLEMYPCIFRRDSARRKASRYFNGHLVTVRYIDAYLTETVGHVAFDFGLQGFNKVQKADNATRECSILHDSLQNRTSQLHEASKFHDLLTVTNNIIKEYVANTEKAAKKALSVYAKAVCTLEQFVEEYHQHVLYLPSEALVNVFYISTQLILFVVLVCVVVVSVLVLIEVGVKNSVGRWLVQSTVFFTSALSILTILFALTILTRIAFTVVLRDETMKNDFSIFSKIAPRQFSENGHHYTLNYTSMLLSATFTEAHILQLIFYTTKTPIAIDPEFLFHPSEQYKESVRRAAEVMVGKYPEYVESTCESAKEAMKSMKTEVENGPCLEKEEAKELLNIVNSSLIYSCAMAKKLKKAPFDVKAIRERSFEKWKNVSLPLKGAAIFRHASGRDNTIPMQLYHVFENPAKKLEPTILEPLFGTAVCFVAMSSVLFLLSLHFMVVVPMILNYENGSVDRSREESNSEESTVNSR